MTLTQSGTYNNLQIQIIAVNSVLVFLSVVGVALRFWARSIQRVSFYADDWLILIALCLALAINALLYYSVHVGLGEHEDTLNPEIIEGYSMNLYIMQLFWNTTLPVTKLSILLFLKRVFTVRTMKYSCYGLMVFLAMWYIAFQTTAIFQCTPIHHNWQRETTEGTCVDFVPFVISLATTNLATDVALLILPVREISKLQMRTTQKIGLSCTFAVGFVICAVAIVRINNLTNIDVEDITYSDTYAHLWTAIESSLGVFVACIPHLMPVYRRVRGQQSTVRSYEQHRVSKTGTSNTQHTDSFGRMRAQNAYTISGSHQYSGSEPDKEGKDSDDDLDLLPKNGIGVRTRLEHRVEPVEQVHYGKEPRNPEAIPMHAL